jgi:hypothetical protein
MRRINLEQEYVKPRPLFLLPLDLTPSPPPPSANTVIVATSLSAFLVFPSVCGRVEDFPVTVSRRVRKGAEFNSSKEAYFEVVLFH